MANPLKSGVSHSRPGAHSSRNYETTLRKDLLDAIDNHDVEAVEAIVAVMPEQDLNTPVNSAGDTYLLRASHFSYRGLGVIRPLVEAGADPTVKDGEGYKPSDYAREHAVESGYAPSVRLSDKLGEVTRRAILETEDKWLARNRKPEIPFEFLQKAEKSWMETHAEAREKQAQHKNAERLFAALDKQDLREVKAAIRDRADVNFVMPLNAKYFAGFSPLTFCVQTGFAAAAPLLLEAGARADMQDGHGRLPLVHALKHKDPLIPVERKPLAPLPESLARPGASARFAFLYASNAKPPERDTAGAHRAHAFFRLFLEAGADPSREEGQGGSSAIDILSASITPIGAYVDELKKGGFDFETRDRDGMTMLVRTIHFGTAENLKSIVDAGADVFTTFRGESAERIADNLGHKDMYRVLRDAQHAVRTQENDRRAEEMQQRIRELERQLGEARRPSKPPSIIPPSLPKVSGE